MCLELRVSVSMRTSGLVCHASQTSLFPPRGLNRSRIILESWTRSGKNCNIGTVESEITARIDITKRLVKRLSGLFISLERLNGMSGVAGAELPRISGSQLQFWKRQTTATECSPYEEDYVARCANGWIPAVGSINLQLAQLSGATRRQLVVRLYHLPQIHSVCFHSTTQ